MQFILNQIGSTLESTFNKVNVIEPLTLGMLNWADSSKENGEAIRTGVYITLPIDHIIKVLSVPFIASFEHFKDILTEKNLGIKILKIVATPVWWPIKTALKTALFTLYFFSYGLRYPIQRWDEIFQFKDPSNSYQQSIDKFNKSFEITPGSQITTENNEQVEESMWKDKFYIPGYQQDFYSELHTPIVKAFDKFCPESQIKKVFAEAFFESGERVDGVPFNGTLRNDFFSPDGAFPDAGREHLEDSNVLLLQISKTVWGSDEKAGIDSLSKKRLFEGECKCKVYYMSPEEYRKLPYEMADELIALLNG